MEPFEPRETKSSAGPTIGIVIILFLMIAGAIYFWNIRNERTGTTPPFIPGSISSTTTTQ